MEKKTTIHEQFQYNEDQFPTSRKLRQLRINIQILEQRKDSLLFIHTSVEEFINNTCLGELGDI